MKKEEFRSLPVFSKSKHINVDRENDSIKNIIIAQYGRNKNESFFDDKFLTDLVKKGNQQTQGVKSRFGHPNMCSNSLGTYVGRYSNFRVEDRKVVADLKLDPISKKTEVEGKGIKMYEYIMDMAESNSDMFGNSIVIKSDSYEGEVEYDNGESKMETIKVLHALLASDLVDDPAATDSLFSVENDFGVAMTDFLDQNPQLFEIVNNKPAILMDFLERYESYYTRKPENSNKPMNLFKTLKEKFGSKAEEDETFNVDLTLAAGGIVTVVTENEQPQDGDVVNDEEGNALEDGEHLLADGRTLVTAEGKITEIREKAEEEEETEDPAAFQAINQRLDKFSEDFSSAINMISDQFAKQDKEIKNLQKTVKSQAFSAPPKNERKKIEQQGEMDFAAKVQAQREARNKKD